MKKKFILLLPFFIFGMSLAGCHGTTNPDTTPAEEGGGEGEGGGQQGDKDKTVAVTSVVLDLTSITLEINGTQQLYASVNPIDATDKTVTWSSSASGVATVNNGLVKGVSAGDAVITATAGGKSATCNVKVNPAAPTVTGIEATYTGEAIEVGSSIDSTQLTVKKVMSDSTKKELTSTEYATLHFYKEQTCENEIPTNYTFQDEDIGQHYVYVKFDTFFASFSIEVVAKQSEVINAHTLRVFSTEVNYPMTYNSEEDEYSVKVTLDQEDTFKIKMSEDDSDWRGYEAFKSDSEVYNNFEEDEGNVKCLVSGKYVFYVNSDPEANGGKTIWVEEIPDATGWKAILNKVNQDVEINSEKESEIMYLGVSLKASDMVIFKDADDSKEKGYDQLKNGQDAFSKGLNNELTVKEEGVYDFYVDISEDKGIWVKKDGADLPEPSKKGHGPEGGELVNWYIAGSGSLWERSFDISEGIQLYSNPSSEDKGVILEITFAVGDIFKVSDGTTWYGYEKVSKWDDPSNKGLHNFESAADGYGGENIKCTVAGTYDIYVNQSGDIWIGQA